MENPIPDREPPYRTIVFDCDSTLSDMEGILELAQGELGERIRRLTDAAMAGEVPLEEVFGQRLEWIRPSRADLEHVGRAYIERGLPNVRELIQALQALGKRVVIVSGGLQPAVLAFARHLGVAEVHAVDVTFDEQGEYLGFDESSPLARVGGKIEVLADLRQRAPSLGSGQPDHDGGLAFIGDGATDLEAAHLADRFIAFGGVIRRDAVFRGARVSCTSRDLGDLVPLLLDAKEREELRSRERFSILMARTPPD